MPHIIFTLGDLTYTLAMLTLSLPLAVAIMTALAVMMDKLAARERELALAYWSECDELVECDEWETSTVLDGLDLRLLDTVTPVETDPLESLPEYCEAYPGEYPHLRALAHALGASLVELTQDSPEWGVPSYASKRARLAHAHLARVTARVTARAA